MNTGPPRWETTQKMRSPSYPSPADLDAYAKRVAHSPLTIQIFPNSVKVPQRKHVRRTVNGLDTSTSQRHSPYSSQLSASAGLLAVLRAPLKVPPPAVRPRGPHKAAMNLHGGSYGSQGSLNSSHVQGSSQQPQLAHLQHGSLPQSAPHPSSLPQSAQAPALQHKGLSHPPGPPPGLLQRQQGLSQLPQRPGFPQGPQRQQSVPLTQQCGPPPAPHGPLLHTLRHHETPPPPHHGPRGGSRAAPQTQELQHLPQLNMAQTPPHSLSTVGPPAGLHQGPGRASQQGPPRAAQPGPPQTPGGQPGPLRTHQPGPPAGQYLGPPGSQPRPPRAPQPGPQQGGQTGPQPGPPGPQGPPRGPLPDPPGAAPFLGESVQPPLAPFGPRKLPDADAPPNVTVSTSTIPLSMAGSLHQRGPGDLSSIVLQINQLCQARAGLGGTSVCEGQIANPSPISRNLLINASSRVNHPPPQGPPFHLISGADKVPGHPQGHPSALPHALPPGHPPGLPPGHPSALPPGHPSALPPGHPSALPPGHPSALPPGHPLKSQPSMNPPNGLQSFHSEVDKGPSLLQRSWVQHQLAHLQQPPEGAHPCKAPRLEAPRLEADCSFAPPQNLSYSHKVPSSAQAFPLKHQDKSGASPPLCSGAALPYMDGQYVQQSWGQPQELPVLQGPRGGPVERFPGQKFKPGGGVKEDPGVQPRLQPNMDFLPGNFQMSRFGDQSVEIRGPRQEPGPGGPLHGHHPGYR